MRKKMLLALSLSLLAPTLVSAHTGAGAVTGLTHGLTHPLFGLDHLLAMVGVGVWAAQLGNRKQWIVPLAFVGVMMLGGALGLSGISLPLVEFGIGASVVVVGLLIALQVRMNTIAAATVAGLFAFFHGHAHGTEVPLAASGLLYVIGFMLSTAGLHIAGIGLARGVKELASARFVQAIGAATALAGVVLFLG